MKNFPSIVILLLIACGPLNKASAQTIDRNSFRSTDSLVGALGPMRDSTLAAIVKALTGKAANEAQKVRAIYMWVAKNIAYDCARRSHPERVNNTASYVLKSRIATSEGFAGMVSEMCRMCYLRCETVRGVARWEPHQIGDPGNELPAAWNVVQIGVRKYVIDAGAGAGDCEGKTFSPGLTDAWFLTQRRLFVLNHFPADKKMQLLDTPVERRAFFNAPVVYKLAPVMGLYTQPGQRGLLKGREGDSVQVMFQLSGGQQAIGAGILADGVKQQAGFRQEGDMVAVTIHFPKSGSYPIYLLLDTDQSVNGGPAFGFMADVSPRRKR